MSLIGRAAREVRSVMSSTSVWGTAAASWSASSSAGVTVTHESALGTSAFFACVRLISDHIATLPVDVFQRYPNGRFGRPKPAWLTAPNPEMTWPEFMQQTVVSEILDGNWFWAIVWGPDGLPSEIWPLDPRGVTVFRDFNSLEVKFRVGASVLSSRDIIHGRAMSQPGSLRGLSVVDAARQTLGIAQAAEVSAGSLYAKGLLSQVVITSDKPVPDATAREMANRLAEAHSGTANAWKPVVFGNGATISPLTITPEQAQFLQSRNFEVEEIARWLGVPLSRIQSQEKSTSWGSGIEQFNIMYTQDAIVPRTAKYEARLAPLIALQYGADHYLKFNVNGLLRGDMAARAQFYQAMTLMGAYSPNNVLAKEDENPFPGGDAHYMQTSYGPILPDGTIKQPSAGGAA